MRCVRQYLQNLSRQRRGKRPQRLFCGIYVSHFLSFTVLVIVLVLYNTYIVCQVLRLLSRGGKDPRYFIRVEKFIS